MPISGPIKGQSVVDSCGFPRLLVQRVYLERFCTLEKEILSPICRWIDLRSFGNTVFSLLVPRTKRNGFPVGQCHLMLSPFRRPLPGFWYCLFISEITELLLSCCQLPSHRGSEQQEDLFLQDPLLPSLLCPISALHASLGWVWSFRISSARRTSSNIPLFLPFFFSYLHRLQLLRRLRQSLSRGENLDCLSDHLHRLRS